MPRFISPFWSRLGILSILTLALSGTSNAFFFSIPSISLTARLNPFRLSQGRCKNVKQSGLLFSTAAATISQSSVREKLLKWEQSAHMYYSVPTAKPIENFDQVRPFSHLLFGKSRRFVGKEVTTVEPLSVPTMRACFSYGLFSIMILARLEINRIYVVVRSLLSQASYAVQSTLDRWRRHAAVQQLPSVHKVVQFNPYSRRQKPKQQI
jgi:hypothetical protein